MIAAAMIRIGIAGWDYRDWEGIVYPAHRARAFDRGVGLIGALLDVAPPDALREVRIVRPRISKKDRAELARHLARHTAIETLHIGRA